VNYLGKPTLLGKLGAMDEETDFEDEIKVTVPITP
jgi:hypothetical protein